MALIGSLSSGVSAMQGFVKGMEVIGDNIANSKTVGFKKQRALYTDSFSQSLSDASIGGKDVSNTAPIQIGTGVGLSATQKLFNQGSIELTGVSSDMAINGDGFFRISNNGTGEQMLTRDGSFRVDKEGFMTDKNGNFLLGLVGGDAANPPSVVGKIQIGLDQDVRLNANGQPIDGLGRIVLDDGTRAYEPTAGGTVYRVDSDGRFLDSRDPSDHAGTFDFNTIEAIILRDDIGTTTDPRAALHSDGNYYLINDQGEYISNTGVVIQDNTSTNISFDPAGTPPVSVANGGTDSADASVWLPTSQPYATLSNTTEIASAAWIEANAGSTDLAIAEPDVTDPNQYQLSIQNWTVNKNGELRLTLNDGSSFVRAQVLIQDVMDADALTEEGAGLFSGIENAGVIGLQTWGLGQTLTAEQLSELSANQGGLGFIQSRALEGSNTDLTQEFSDMITTQRAFQAGSKVITVSDEMLQEIINLKR
ncbi:MAG: flagellar hook-basal body complex protein [Opitutales bacterium]